MIAYTSYTGTKTTRIALRKRGWRFLMTPQLLANYAWRRPLWVDGTPAGYCLDNGAYGYYLSEKPFNNEAFIKAADKVGTGADWIVLPDIVAGGCSSLDLSLSWISKLKKYNRPLLLAVQDGMTAKQVAPHLSDQVGIFVGGSTDWKLETVAAWGLLAKRLGCLCHVARVNTVRRIRLCQYAGAHSFDGTGPIMFPSTLGKLDHARRQLSFWGP